VMTFPASARPELSVTGEGYAIRPIFLSGPQGVVRGFQEDDTLALPDQKMSSVLGLVRIVKPQSIEPSSQSSDPHLSDGVVEHVAFEKSKGMIALLQLVGGKLAMDWTLVNFTPGHEGFEPPVVTNACEVDALKICENARQIELLGREPKRDNKQPTSRSDVHLPGDFSF
jgi:hypothetical protein